MHCENTQTASTQTVNTQTVNTPVKLSSTQIFAIRVLMYHYRSTTNEFTRASLKQSAINIRQGDDYNKYAYLLRESIWIYPRLRVRDKKFSDYYILLNL
jgi:hypothetical protein